MRYETTEGTTHIWCDEGESERDVLRAIANATFETAAAVGMGLMHYNPDTVLPEEYLERVVNLDGDRVLSMEYVEGRQVKTSIDRVEPGHFTLQNYSFERDRGAPDTMLNRAIEILGGAEATGHQSTMQMFEGENLDQRAKARYGIERNAGETDWEFRKRIFLDFFDQDQDALTFCLGGTIGDLDDMDGMLVVINADTFGTRHGRQRFVDGFAADPLVMRKERMAHVG
jgi:hypothetical protein